MSCSSSISDELLLFVTQQLALEGQAFSPTTPLRDAGLDSFALMELLLFVEKKFGVRVPLEKLTAENMHSIETLSRCVDALQSA